MALFEKQPKTFEEAYQIIRHSFTDAILVYISHEDPTLERISPFATMLNFLIEQRVGDDQDILFLQNMIALLTWSEIDDELHEMIVSLDSLKRELAELFSKAQGIRIAAHEKRKKQIMQVVLLAED